MERYETPYSGMKENELYLLFGTDRWAGLNAQQRLHALQEIENRFAWREGRTPCRVMVLPEDEQASESDGYLCGQMDYYADGGPAIYLNGGYLGIGADADYMASAFNSAAALDTLLHEGRHCYQEQAVQEGNLPVDPDTLRNWGVNSLHYINSDYSDVGAAIYEFQPIERDANHFAAVELREIYRHIVCLTGERDVGFEEAMQRLLQDRAISVMRVAECLDEQIVAEYSRELTDTMNALYECDGSIHQALMVMLGIDPDEAADAYFRDVRRIMHSDDVPLEYLDGLDTYVESLQDFTDLEDDLKRFDGWLRMDFRPLKENLPIRESPDRRVDKLDRGMRRFM